MPSRVPPARIDDSLSGNRPGQAAVEFALVFIVLVAVIYGILEISRLIFINAELQNAAREASRYAARHPFVSADE